MRWSLFGLMLMCGCEPIQPVDTDLTQPLTGQPTTTVPTGPEFDDEGNIVLMLLHAEPDNPTDRVVLAGVFGDSMRDWRNLAQCLSLREDSFCADDLPEVNDQYVTVQPYTEDLVGLIDTRNVGPNIRFAQYTVNHAENNGYDIYYSANLAGSGLPQDGNVGFSFSGGEWGDFDATDVISVPDRLAVTSPDPLRPQTLAPGLFRITWTPGLVGDVYLSVMGDSVQRLYRLQDDGVHDLDVNSLNLQNEEEVRLTLGRWTRTVLEQDGNEIEIAIQDEQTIRATYRDLPNRTELFGANTCADAAVLPLVQSGSYYGRMQAATNTLSPSGCVTNGAGPEVLLRTELNPDGEISVDYLIFGSNAVGYLMTSCGNFGTCLDGANNTGTGALESLGWINDTGSVAEVFIGLDSAAGPVNDVFLVDVDIVQVNPSPLVDACADALAQVSLTSSPPGTDRYVGNINTFQNYADPAGYCYVSAPGQEGMVKVELAPGETLEATVEMPGADPVLYLLYNCAQSASCPVGADADTSEFETVVYTNASPASEVLYLIVDSHGGSASYTLDLLIQ